MNEETLLKLQQLLISCKRSVNNKSESASKDILFTKAYLEALKDSRIISFEEFNSYFDYAMNKFSTDGITFYLSNSFDFTKEEFKQLLNSKYGRGQITTKQSLSKSVIEFVSESIKKGDKLYCTQTGDIEEYEVSSLGGVDIYVENINDYIVALMRTNTSEINKSIFLTRESAEKSIREQEKK